MDVNDLFGARPTTSYKTKQRFCAKPVSEIQTREQASIGNITRHVASLLNGKESTTSAAIGDTGPCQLFALNELIAEKKHMETSETIFESKSKEEAEIISMSESDDIHQPKRAAGETEKLRNLNSDSGHPPAFATSVGKSLSIEQVPLYLRYLRANYPFGNVHVALRFGPLIFENGLSDTEGAVISRRALPELQQSSAVDGNVPRLELTERDLNTDNGVLKGSWTRTLYEQERPRKDKRYKAMAKQVVGGAFSGLFDRAIESHIAQTLVEEADGFAIEEMSPRGRSLRIEKSMNLLFAKVQTYLSPRVEEYVDRIVQRLLDPSIALRWDRKKNSCQTLCDKLIDTETFGPLLAPQNDSDPSPLYLMSFICRSNDYISRGPGSTHGVPHGHVEEYLLKYRFGCHDDSDIMDTLQEYWHDWGNFEGVLYPYQDLFPWDCTQGFDKSPPHTCGSCNISEHVWAFPFDSHSLISLHLSRSRNFYPQGERPTLQEEDEGVMTDSEWFRNRLILLTGQYSLLMGATAMVKSEKINRDVRWLEKNDTDDIDRIKLGGIVRAQPFSHRFEKDNAGHKYYQYYVAGWTSLKLRDRKDQYEKLRNWRAEQKGGLDELKRLTEKKKWHSRARRKGNGEGGSAPDSGGNGGEDGIGGDSHCNLLDIPERTQGHDGGGSSNGDGGDCGGGDGGG
ncbi:hypothetical protein NW768_000966 [Fusarium equiseti]|uniref:Uncharacterized protein n=1 Tax=Fusarium equiseti TaxID=61235 RepID=A0ABQ8RTY8_FUSEQ|nr:hypothetical protein NW768_000966 [Fusarium equiseti]